MIDRTRMLPVFITICLLLNSSSITIAQSVPDKNPVSSAGLQIADVNQCIVPLISYEVSFSDFSEKQGKIAWTCQTAGLHAANFAGDPIIIYLQIYEHNLNTDQVRWNQLSKIEPNQSLELPQYFYSGKGGTINSQVEYMLPLKMVALYATDECFSYIGGQEPPQLAQSNAVTLDHPCPGPEGGVAIPGGETATEQPTELSNNSTEEAQQPTATQLADVAEEEDPLPAGLMYVLFTSGDLRGFEQTPEGRALSAEERSRIAEFLSEMGLLTHFGDTLVYPENHPCYGLTSREICEDYQRERQLETEKQRRFEAALERAENEYIRRQRINRIVQEEIAGRGRFLQYTKDVLNLMYSPPDPIKYASDKFEELIKDQVTPDEIKAMDIASYEQVLSRGIKAVIDLATSDAPNDYDRYLEFYHANLQIGLDSEEAHTDAIEKLKQEILAGRPGRSSFIEAYDRAFQRLNRIYGGEGQ